MFVAGTVAAVSVVVTFCRGSNGLSLSVEALQCDNWKLNGLFANANDLGGGDGMDWPQLLVWVLGGSV